MKIETRHTHQNLYQFVFNIASGYGLGLCVKGHFFVKVHLTNAIVKTENHHYYKHSAEIKIIAVCTYDVGGEGDFQMRKITCLTSSNT